MPHADIVRLGGRFPNRSRTVVHGGLVWTLATSGTKVQDFGQQMRDALRELGAELERAGTDQSRITFSVDGKYGWERTIACGTPPCPTNWVSGTWRVQHGKLYLDPNVGGDEIVVFRFEDQQKYLYLKDGDA